MLTSFVYISPGGPSPCPAMVLARLRIGYRKGSIMSPLFLVSMSVSSPGGESFTPVVDLQVKYTFFESLQLNVSEEEVYTPDPTQSRRIWRFG
jgi:hypothetical protein